jgi:hypothetical protein
MVSDENGGSAFNFRRSGKPDFMIRGLGRNGYEKARRTWFNQIGNQKGTVE